MRRRRDEQLYNAPDQEDELSLESILAEYGRGGRQPAPEQEPPQEPQPEPLPTPTPEPVPEPEPEYESTAPDRVALKDIMSQTVDAVLEDEDDGVIAQPVPLSERIAGLLARLRRRAEYLARRSLRARLAAFLLDAAADAGGNTFSLGMRREDLAAYLGANRSALCRELSRLRAEGWIDCCRDSVRLIHTAALAESAAAENRSGEK